MSAQVPEFGRAAVVRNKGPNYSIECVENHPVPKPKRGELLLRLKCTGLCMSDHHFMSQDWQIPMMVDTAGHEGAGVVVAKGEEVGEGWQIGDRAGLKPISDTCHGCTYCREGRETYCDGTVYSGCMTPGSYGQYVAVPARYTTRIPDGVDDAIAGPVMCSGSTVYSAIKASNVKFGQYLLIVGAGGGVGSMGIQYGKAMGLRVIAMDGGDDKRDLCLQLGAEEYIDFTKSKDLAADVQKVTRGGAHAVVVTGGVAGAYKGVAQYTRKLGTVVAVGLPTAGTAWYGDDPVPLIFKKVTLSGMTDMDEAFDIAARGLVKPHVTVYPFKEFPQRLKELTQSKIAGRAVIDFDA